MSHMVIYRGPDGKPGYQQAEDIHDAVTFVEQMRNEDGVEQARIFRLEEVVFEYRPYFRVELSSFGLPDAMIGAAPSPMMSAPSSVPIDVMEESSVPIDVMEESSMGSLDEPFEVVESSTINVDEPDADAIAGNGARRGLFGR